MKERAQDEIAAALFAAGAEERAPAALRSSLLARLREPELLERRAPDSEPGAGEPRPLRRFWQALAAAAVLSLLGVWSLRPPAVPGPILSPEHVPPRAASARAEALAQKPAPSSSAAEEAAGDVRGEPLRPPVARPHRDRAPRPRPPERAAEPRDRVELPGSREVEAPGTARVMAPPAAASSVAEQLEVLRGARQALRGGAPSRALQLLDGEQQALERGEFAAEARLLRIEALAGANRHSEARALAREFVQRFPHDPLSDRARRFLAAPRTDR